MKTLALIITLVLTSIFSYAQDSESTYTLTVTVENALNDKGHFLVGLHSSDTFMKEKGVQSSTVEIKEGKAIITFKNVAAGSYAIMALHDENDNSRMDFEANGRPKESYGLSNNPMLYGPPTFGDAKFEVTEDTEMVIRF